MAVITIDNIQTMQHLEKLIDYIQDNEKTDNGYLISTFMCLKNCVLSIWEYTRNQAMNKGNNLAWHITQSFSPDDNVTPEQAHQLGREFMEKKFPGYQYIIATHIDKGHIHNHIVLNSVNYLTHKKLNTNKRNYYEMREVSDEICLRNGLSVIEKNSKSKTMQLKANIDETIKNSKDINEFIAEMQNKGYVVKRGKNYFSFKNKEMGRFIRSTSISLDYTEQAIKTRIEACVVGRKTKEPKKHRQIQDDKVKYHSQRKILKVEIDNSIEKCNSWEEFKADMQRKKILVNDKGKHLIMRLPEGERNIRTEGLGLEYQEEFIKYRLEFKEEFKMMNEIIPKMYNQNARNVDGGLYEWMAGENIGIHRKSIAFIEENGIDSWQDQYELFYKFMKKYNSENAKIKVLESNIEDLNVKIRALIEVKNAIKVFWKYKATVNDYRELLNNEELNSLEKEEYINIINEFITANETLEFAKNNYKLDKDVYSYKAVQGVIDDLLEQKRTLTKEKLEAKYNFQNWENIKYNLEMDYSVNEKHCNEIMQARQEKEQKKQERKDKFKGFLGL